MPPSFGCTDHEPDRFIAITGAVCGHEHVFKERHPRANNIRNGSNLRTLSQFDRADIYRRHRHRHSARHKRPASSLWGVLFNLTSRGEAPVQRSV
jgi:hypothetical protein